MCFSYVGYPRNRTRDFCSNKRIKPTDQWRNIATVLLGVGAMIRGAKIRIKVFGSKMYHTSANLTSWRSVDAKKYLAAQKAPGAPNG